MRNLKWLLIIVFSYAVDRITKHIIVLNVKSEKPLQVIPDFFYIVFSENTGAAWGILKNGRYYFIVLTIIVLIVLVYILIRFSNSQSRLLGIAISLIIGGAAGNLTDRIISGSVTDFLDFYLWSFHFPTFNFADMCLVSGTILLSVFLLFIYKD